MERRRGNRVLAENLGEENHLEDPDIDGRISSKSWINLRTGLIWLEIYEQVNAVMNLWDP
jgi:hypothetical protein